MRDTHESEFPPAPPRARRGPAVLPLAGSLVGLAGGFLAGWLIKSSGLAGLQRIPDFVGVAGALWMNALQMIVLPLLVTTLVVAVASGRAAGSAGRITAGTVCLFFAFHGLAAAFTLLAAPPAIAWFKVDPQTVAALRGSVPTELSAAADQPRPSIQPGGWVPEVVPKNLFRAALDNELLPLLVATVLFALALSRTRHPSARLVARFFEGTAEVISVLVGWILWLTPVGVFALGLQFTAKAGIGVSNVLGQFVLLACGLMLAFTILLYPITALLGGLSLRRFALAVLPAQVTAVGTQSSIASLPALLDGAGTRLNLDPIAERLVLPLSVAVFRLNRGISSTAKLLFLAHVFAVPLGPGRITAFVVAATISSFTLPGIPGGGSSFRTLPAYLAAGVPIEGVVLLQAAEVITDVFRTLLNVTGDMSIAAIVSRFAGERPRAVTAVAGPAEDVHAAAGADS